MRTRLGEQRFAKLFAAGRTQAVESAIADARRLARLIAATRAQEPSHDPLAVLSSRQREVLQMVAQGIAAREIGDALFISKKGNKCIVTNQRVVWFDQDGSITILPVHRISRATKDEKGTFRKEFNLYLWRPNGTTEWTAFDSEHQRDGMANAVQRAMQAS